MIGNEVEKRREIKTDAGRRGWQRETDENDSKEIEIK